MLVKCPVCGGHCPTEAAIEVMLEGELRRFCSARCAEEAEGAEAVPLPELPPVPRRILVAVDGSGPSLRAVELAASLARESGGELRLLSAVDPRALRAFDLLSGTSAAIDLGVRPQEVERMLREDAAAQLERAERLCRQCGVKFTTQVELAAALEAIARAAEESDLVVMGSRGLGAVSGAVLGSLSQRVIAACKTPVLVVH